MKRYGLWIIAILLITTLLTVLATRWNIAWVQRPSQDQVEQVLGTLGFIVVLGGFLLFGIKLFKEMRLNQAQTEFLARVSHELKTPLATLELSSELLKTETSPTEQKRLWSLHAQELNRLKTEVEILLESSRWDTQNKKSNLLLEFQNFALEEWLKIQWDSWRTRAGTQSSLTRTGELFHKEIEADSRYLRLIIDNLIENAKKYSLNGKAEIEFHTSHDDYQWKIQLIDKGWGFHPKDANKIFKRFYRSSNLAPYSIAGTGLGLYLSQQAALKMGMQLRAFSEGKAKGSTFTLEGYFKA